MAPGTEEREQPHTTSAAEAPTMVIQTAPGTGPDQCAGCGAPLATDQRYCVECGQRRGVPRFTLDDPSPPAASEGTLARAAGPLAPPPAMRLTSGSSLIAGVGTLLLALGIGVLIGRSGTSSSSKAPPVQVVSVAGGGPAAATTTPTAATASAAPAKPIPVPKSTAAAQQAVSKIATIKPKAPPPKVVTVGTPGSGPGYQKGKFTGNFFGG